MMYVILAKAIKLMDQPLDDFQIFGDYIASELRTLRAEQLQRKLKKNDSKGYFASFRSGRSGRTWKFNTGF